MPTQWEKEYKGDDPAWEAYLERVRTGKLMGYELFRLSRQGDPATGRKLTREHAQRSDWEDVKRVARKRRYWDTLRSMYDIEATMPMPLLPWPPTGMPAPQAMPGAPTGFPLPPGMAELPAPIVTALNLMGKTLAPMPEAPEEQPPTPRIPIPSLIQQWLGMMGPAPERPLGIPPISEMREPWQEREPLTRMPPSQAEFMRGLEPAERPAIIPEVKPQSAWERIWEALQERPPALERIGEFVGRALDPLSPFLEPLGEMARIVTSREALADDARILLGEVNADLQGYEVPRTEMRLRNLLGRAVVGFYSTWWDLISGVLKKGDDAKNIAFSIASRQIEKAPITYAAHVSPESPFYGLPTVYSTEPVILALQNQYEEETGRKVFYTPEEYEQLRGNLLLTKEELDEAVREHEAVWSIMMMPPTFREDLREQVRTGDITWEEVMGEHRNDNLELAMNLITTPWWFAPSGAFETAFAPVTKPLGLVWRGVKKIPILKSLFEWSKRTKIEKHADDAAGAFDKMMRRIPGWRQMVDDVSFRSATKFELETFADDMMRVAEKGPEAIAEALGLSADDATRLGELIEFAGKGGFDLRNLIATAGSKESLLARIRWVARMERAAELGVDLSRDRAFITETMQFMKEQWLGPNPAYVATNFMDNSAKSLMHGFFPGGNYEVRFGQYGMTMPGYVQQTLAKSLGLEARTVTGRLGIPLISKPENWIRGYAMDALETALGKRATKPIVKWLGRVVDYQKRPELGGLGKALSWMLDHANLESLVLLGRRGWNIEYAFRAEGVLHRMGGVVETSRPEFADDLYRAVLEAGFSEAEAIAVRDGVLSRLVNSTDDVGRVLQRLFPEGEAPVYGLADYPLQYSGKLAEIPGWLRTSLDDLERAGRATPENISSLFAQARRAGEGVIDDVERVAEGELPISQILGDIEDIAAIQGARRDVAVHRLGSLMNKVERTVIEGELPQSVLDDTAKIRNRVIFRGRKLIRNALKKGEGARKDMIVEPLEQLAKDLRAGKIDQAQFAIRYSQLVTAYKNYTRPMWDKANDDFVRIISAGIERIQGQSNIFEEPLSQELMGKLARVEAIMKNVKATFREQFLGDWLDDATKLTDEIGKWEEWALAKLVPEERVAEVVGAEALRGARPVFEVPDPLTKEALEEAKKIAATISEGEELLYIGPSTRVAATGTPIEPGEVVRAVGPYPGRELAYYAKMPSGETVALDIDWIARIPTAEAVAPEVVAPPVERTAAETQSTVARLIEQFSGRWQTIIDDGIDEGIQYSKDIFFDYGQQMAVEEKASWWFPFIHWQILNPFYWLKHAAEMPWIPNAIRLFEWETDQHRQERGLTARFRWTVETPLDEWAPRFFPEGYYGTDFRPFMSLLTQLGIFAPYGEPFRWGEEDSAGKLLRAGEWIGLTPYPWWQAVTTSITEKETPDAGSLFPITRAVRDLFGIDLGHITDIEDYYAKLELAARVACNELDKWTAKNAIIEGAGNPHYDSALAEAQDVAKRLDLIRLFIPFTIKYASPGELAIREEIMQRREMPREERPEVSPGLSTYYYLWLEPQEQKNALAYETYVNRINEMNKYLSAQAQMYGIGTKRWRNTLDEYWDARDGVRGEYEEAITPETSETMRWILAAPLQQAVTSYRNLTRQFFDGEGELKEGYEWPDVISAQELFKRELVRGTPERRPISLLAFEQAYYKWEIPEEAVLRAWEKLYGRAVWEVINATEELDREQANRLISEAKRIANRSRDNKSELMAEIIRIHPDWTREQVEKALRVNLPHWDQWARRNQPLEDALWSTAWGGYMALSDLDKREFRDWMRQEYGPQLADIIEKVWLPRERLLGDKEWKRDKKLVPLKVLLAINDQLDVTSGLAAEGFAEEVAEAREEVELPEPEELYKPVPVAEAAEYNEYLQRVEQYQALKTEQGQDVANEWIRSDARTQQLFDKFGPDTPVGQARDRFWTGYNNIPPGPLTKELRSDPLIAAILKERKDSPERETRGVAFTAEQYGEAARRIEAWGEKNPDVAGMGNAEEYQMVKDMVAYIYEQAEAAGPEDSNEYKQALNKMWSAARADPNWGPLINKYYPPRTGGGRPPGMAMPTPPDHPATVPVHTPEQMGAVAEQRPTGPGDLLNPEETLMFRGWVFEEAGFTPEAQEELQQIDLRVKRSVGGGGGWGGWEESYLELGAPSLEAAIHEYAHAHWDMQPGERKTALIEAVKRLAGETDPQYQLAARLADVYIRGEPLWRTTRTGFPGMRLSESVLPPSVWGYGPGDVWNDQEMFAGLASGIMGDLSQLPPYIRPFYEGLFTGEVKEREAVEYTDIWPAMAIRTEGVGEGTTGPGRGGGGQPISSWYEFTEIAGPEIAADLEDLWDRGEQLPEGVAVFDYLWSLYQQYSTGQESFDDWLVYLRSLRGE